MNHQKNSDDALFLAKIADLFAVVQRQNVVRYTSFLDEKQTFLAQQYAEQSATCRWMLWGGYENATRKMLGVFPDYLEPNEAHFPIAPITFTYRREDALTHRDFLGCVMALQVKRETVGDILVQQGNAVLFATDKIEPLLMQELQKIGRVGVKLQRGITVPISHQQQYEYLSGTVASMRLDCVVSLMTGKSREKSCDLIKAGYVQLNYQEMQDNSAAVLQDDILSVRGYGKAKVGADIQKTKKDRYRLTLCKYR